MNATRHLIRMIRYVKMFEVELWGRGGGYDVVSEYYAHAYMKNDLQSGFGVVFPTLYSTLSECQK